MSTQPDKMTKELHLKFVEAWWDGELEVLDETDGSWHQDESQSGPWVDEPPSIYRIRPKPTLRPWKPEEVPVGAVFRSKSHPLERSVILGVTDDELQLPMVTNLQSVKFWSALEKGEHSTDGGKTWKPCGVEEVE